jgi:hypothetical protein
VVSYFFVPLSNRIDLFKVISKEVIIIWKLYWSRANRRFGTSLQWTSYIRHAPDLRSVKWTPRLVPCFCTAVVLHTHKDDIWTSIWAKWGFTEPLEPNTWLVYLWLVDFYILIIWFAEDPIWRIFLHHWHVSRTVPLLRVNGEIKQWTFCNMFSSCFMKNNVKSRGTKPFKLFPLYYCWQKRMSCERWSDTFYSQFCVRSPLLLRSSASTSLM